MPRRRAQRELFRVANVYSNPLMQSMQSERTAPRTLFRNAALLDPVRGEIEPDRSLVSDAGRIVDVGGPGLSAGEARVVD